MTRVRAEIWDDAFKKINSNQAAYWLGFTFGGVCMRKRGNNYAMSVYSHRKTNVEALSDFIEYKGKIATKTSKHGTRGYQIHISSKNMFEQLNYLGVPPSKRTLSVNFPSLKDSYKLSFIRGYCDNNSHISQNQSGKNAGKFNQLYIGGPRHFLEPMRDFIDIDLDLNTSRPNLGTRIVSRTNNSCALQYPVGTGVKVCRHLYGNIKDVKEIRHRNRDRILKVL